MKERIKACIDNLKHLPGVYLMHDKDDKIIYIGKAKDLFKRVSQYFSRPQVGKVAKMAFEAEYFAEKVDSPKYGDKRQGSRRGTYWVVIKDDKGKEQKLERSLDEWKDLKEGDKVKYQTHRYSDDPL